MKHIQLRINILVFSFVASVLIFPSCGDDIEGTYKISGEALKYKTDTTVFSFQMIDSYGITEEFYMDTQIWYVTHNYFSEWGEKAYYETFGIAYGSVVNNYFFMFVMRAQETSTELEVEWNQKDLMNYDFGTRMMEFEPGGMKISFYDTLQVRGVTYHDIIEIDYSASRNEIDKNTPVKTWIAGKEGLIKFERKDGVVSERL